MNEKRESSATIDRKKSIRDAVRIVTIGKNGVAYNNSDVARGCISPIFPNNIDQTRARKIKRAIEGGMRLARPFVPAEKVYLSRNWY
jgi:hypothetical protein